MDPFHSKITQTLEVHCAFLGFCYSKAILYFVSSQMFTFGEVNTQLSH